MRSQRQENTAGWWMEWLSISSFRGWHSWVSWKVCLLFFLASSGEVPRGSQEALWVTRCDPSIQLSHPGEWRASVHFTDVTEHLLWVGLRAGCLGKSWWMRQKQSLLLQSPWCNRREEHKSCTYTRNYLITVMLSAQWRRILQTYCSVQKARRQRPNGSVKVARQQWWGTAFRAGERMDSLFVNLRGSQASLPLISWARAAKN